MATMQTRPLSRKRSQVRGAPLWPSCHLDDTDTPTAVPSDPDDKRSLYDRLKEQKDAKQEEWEHKHTFKNQARCACPLARRAP